MFHHLTGFRFFIPTFGILGFLLVMGNIGYQSIEGWNGVDATYMTVITITTVGFGEIHPLSQPGRIFTIFLILGGVLFYGVTVNNMVQTFMERRFSDVMNDLRNRRYIEQMNGHYIICGGGRIGLTIGQELERTGNRFVFVDVNPNAVVRNFRKDWPFLAKDALLEETLKAAGIDRAIGLAAVLPTDADNLFLVLSARSLNQNLIIHTRIASESSRSKMMQAGANRVVSPYTEGGLQIARGLLNPEVQEFMEVFFGKFSVDFEMKVHRIEPYDVFCNKKIDATEFRSEGSIVIGVKDRSGGLVFAPPGDFLLREGQEILVINELRKS